MNAILLTVGAACVVLAVVGGGGKVLGVELPVIRQTWRIVVLAVAGVGFLLAAYFLRETTPTSEPTEVKAYRAAVVQICADMTPRTNAFGAAMNTDGTFDRNRLQQALQAQADLLRTTMAQLWQRPVPREVTDVVAVARAASDDAVAAADAQIKAIPTKLPRKISIQQLQAWATDFSQQLSSHDTAMRSALSEISGQPCTPPAGQGQ